MLVMKQDFDGLCSVAAENERVMLRKHIDMTINLIKKITTAVNDKPKVADHSQNRNCMIKFSQ